MAEGARTGPSPTPDTPEAPERVSLAEDVYRRLRAAIVRGEYRPNQRLVEVDLAQRLNASRTPVREGLQRLQAEGLVGVHRRGWVVREYTARDIRHIYDVRIPLEAYASRLAVTRASSAEIAHIVSLETGLTEELAGSNRERFVELHDELHDSLYAASNNPVLVEVIRVHRGHQFNRRVTSLYSDEQLRTAIASHGLIVDALWRRDATAVEELTREHLRTAMEVTLSLTEEP